MSLLCSKESSGVGQRRACKLRRWHGDAGSCGKRLLQEELAPVGTPAAHTILTFTHESVTSLQALMATKMGSVSSSAHVPRA